MESRTLMSTTLVSVSADGVTAGGGALLLLNGQGSTNFSPDGRFVVFASTASNLVNGVTDTNNANDVFIRDLQTGTTAIISVDTSGNALGMEGSAQFQSFVFSPDSRRLLFRTQAANFVPGLADTNNAPDWFVRNLLTGATTCVTINAAGTSTGNSTSFTTEPPSFSPDGKLIAFGSIASDLVIGVTDLGGRDYFIRNLETNTTSYISIATNGTASGNTSDAAPLFRADGRYVAFLSFAANLDPTATDSNGTTDLYVRDLQLNTTTLVTRTVTNTAAGFGGKYRFTADGKTIIFDTAGTNLVSGVTDLNSNLAGLDLYQWNLAGQTMKAISVTPDGGSTGDKAAHLLDVSPDSRFVAFGSASTNLTAQSAINPDALDDLYVRDLQTNTTKFISRNASASVVWGLAKFSPDGTHLVFDSFQNNLVPGISDTNNTSDLFLYNVFTDTVSVVTINSSGTATSNNLGGTNHDDTVISPNGRYISFVSDAHDLIPNFTSTDTRDLFVRDTVANTTLLATQYINGGGAGYDQGGTGDAEFSPDSKFLVFASSALLADGVTTPFTFNFQRNLYAFDLTIAADRNLTPGANGSQDPFQFVMNPAANSVLFVNAASNLVNGISDPTTFSPDAFIGTLPTPGSVPGNPTPHLAVQGGINATIVNLDLSPGANDGTDFGTTTAGTPVTHSFIVNNTGTAEMTTSNLSIPAGFTLIDGLNASIPAGGNDSFTVRYDANATASGNVSFNTNDSNFGTFTFAIKGATTNSGNPGGPGGGPAPGPADAPDLVASGGVTGVKDGNFVGGTKGGKAQVKVVNQGPEKAKGSLQVTFFASTDGTLDDGDTALVTVNKSISLKTGKSKTIKGKFNYPSTVLDGLFFVLARIDGSGVFTEVDESNNVAASANAIGIAAPFVDLSGTALVQTKKFKAGKSGNATLTVANGGNVKSSGTAEFQLFASTDDIFGNGDDILIADIFKSASIKPGKTKGIKFKASLAAVPAGSIRLFSVIDKNNAIAESDEGNNNPFSATLITVV